MAVSIYPSNWLWVRRLITIDTSSQIIVNMFFQVISGLSYDSEFVYLYNTLQRFPRLSFNVQITLRLGWARWPSGLEHWTGHQFLLIRFRSLIIKIR